MWQPKTRNSSGKQQILCQWRHRWVRLTPEEWVRQQVLHQLVEQLGYPHNMIAVEHQIEVGELRKRCDAVVFSQTLEPLCIIEFKAETVKLTQQVFDQVAIYNRRLGVGILMLSNGQTTYAAQVGENNYNFLDHIPTYQELCKKR